MLRTLRLAVLIAVLLTLSALPAAAHEGREVGEYLLSFGWRQEPAYAGMMNGPEVFISLHDAPEDEPFPADIEVSLYVHAMFGEEMVMMPLRPAYGTTGHYIAELVPTLPGDYSFHVFGTIGDTEVDESFSSADGEFSTVEPAGDILFPAVGAAEARIADLEARIAALEALVAELQSAGN